jgi:Phosphoinositide polyphosphatase (Sac family)
MDCLDRTNVVQSVIARRLLWKALERAEIFKLPYQVVLGLINNKILAWCI